MKKIVSENLNEFLNEDNPYVVQFLEEYGIENLADIHPSDLADFIDDNWGEITSLSNRDKDAEQDFPSQVLEILRELNIDYSDFSDWWSSMREGINDWEDEDNENY